MYTRSVHVHMLLQCSRAPALLEMIKPDGLIFLDALKLAWTQAT